MIIEQLKVFGDLALYAQANRFNNSLSNRKMKADQYTLQGDFIQYTILPLELVKLGQMQGKGNMNSSFGGGKNPKGGKISGWNNEDESSSASTVKCQISATRFLTVFWQENALFWVFFPPENRQKTGNAKYPRSGTYHGNKIRLNAKCKEETKVIT